MDTMTTPPTCRILDATILTQISALSDNYNCASESIADSLFCASGYCLDATKCVIMDPNNLSRISKISSTHACGSPTPSLSTGDYILECAGFYCRDAIK
jgi:hypothetical protein